MQHGILSPAAYTLHPPSLLSVPALLHVQPHQEKAWHVLQGSARVFRCLQDQRAALTLDCKTALFDHEVIMAESVNFNKPLAQACTDEVSRYCKGVPSGDARVLWCLRQHKDESDFGKGCSKARLWSVPIVLQLPAYANASISPLRAAQCSSQKCAAVQRKLFWPRSCPVIHGPPLVAPSGKHALRSRARVQELRRFERSMGRDYRLNRRLASACESDVPALCADECDFFSHEACGGRVLRCLTKKRAQIKKSACKKEVFYFMKMEARPRRCRARPACVLNRRLTVASLHGCCGGILHAKSSSLDGASFWPEWLVASIVPVPPTLHANVAPTTHRWRGYSCACKPAPA